MKYRSVLITGIIGIMVVLGLAVCFMIYKPMGETVRLSHDLDGNGGAELYLLEKGRLTVREGDRLLWETPAAWNIQSCLIADADNDGQEELLLVLWKKGSFGSSKPMWQQGPDDEYSNHLFLYRLAGGKMKPAWCSSALVHPIIKLEVLDLNQDGKNELKILQGPLAGRGYNLRQIFSRQSTSWVWQGWGFYQM